MSLPPIFSSFPYAIDLCCSLSLLSLLYPEETHDVYGSLHTLLSIEIFIGLGMLSVKGMLSVNSGTDWVSIYVQNLQGRDNQILSTNPHV